MTVAVTDPKPTRPRWRAEAEQVSTYPLDALPIGEVAAQIGVSTAHILTAMLSTAYTGERSRMRQIARPRWDLEGVPLWHPDQVADYHNQVAARHNVREEFANLPTVNRAGAIKIQAVSLHGMSRVSTVPVTTLHRWKLEAGFPPPVAIMEVNSPTPRLLYSWLAVREHMMRCHADWFATRAPEIRLHARTVTEP